MQQECLSTSIMTSSRPIPTALRRASFVIVTCIAMMLGACAALPNDSPVVEELDADTGATVARVGKPLELYREAVPNVYADRFAFLAPFETNQMGQRESFLWLAVPVTATHDSAPPTVEVNGTALALGTPGREPDFAGLRKSPYKTSASWNAVYYFKADAAVIARLGEAEDLLVRSLEMTQKGPIPALFTLKVAADPRLRDFAAR
jgi:hypothetical protein